jgi:AraC family transcriptional regulator of adaptative response/methylated-DNA-[protein]-cysteine methyltransferase
LAKNVEFFEKASYALYAGYRPCMRCRPMESGDQPPDWLRPLLEEIERDPAKRLRDSELVRFGIAPERARRYFKSKFGMTFQGYHRARRMGLAFKGIREGKDAVEAAMEQGYDSDSGFRDAFAKVFGVSPSTVQPTPAQHLVASWIETPLGPMLAAADDDALILLEFVDRRMLPVQIERMRKLFGCAVTPGTNAILQQTERELAEYYEGKRMEFTVPLHLRGSEFQVKAWNKLLTIPYGKTESYGQMAKEIGHPDAQRAVGRANGDNRIAIIIPCHRVVRSDGTLCGYGGGLWRKKRLLELETGQGTLG